MILVIICALSVWLILSGIVANDFYEIAFEKGFPQKRYFWFSFLFGIIGWIMVCALPDRKGQNIVTVNTETKSQQDDSLPEL